MTRRRERWLQVLFGLAALLVVGLACGRLGSMGGVSALLFPSPAAFVNAVAQPGVYGRLAGDFGATCLRLLAGLAIGGVIGVLLGLIMGWSATTRRWLDPVIAALHPLPKVALLPLLMMAFGIGDASKIAAIATASFFPMLISCMAGVRSIQPIHFEVASNYGAGRLATFRRVVWPGSLPMTLTGLRLAFNAGLLVAVAVEMVSARQGLGALIWIAWQTLNTPELYLGLLIIASIGLGVNAWLKGLTTRLTPWSTPAD